MGSLVVLWVLITVVSMSKAEVCLKVASNLFKSAAGYFSSCWAIAERAELPEVIVKRKMVSV